MSTLWREFLRLFSSISACSFMPVQILIWVCCHFSYAWRCFLLLSLTASLDLRCRLLITFIESPYPSIPATRVMRRIQVSGCFNKNTQLICFHFLFRFAMRSISLDTFHLFFIYILLYILLLLFWVVFSVFFRGG